MYVVLVNCSLYHLTVVVSNVCQEFVSAKFDLYVECKFSLSRLSVVCSGDFN